MSSIYMNLIYDSAWTIVGEFQQFSEVIGHNIEPPFLPMLHGPIGGLPPAFFAKFCSPWTKKYTVSSPLLPPDSNILRTASILVKFDRNSAEKKFRKHLHAWHRGGSASANQRAAWKSRAALNQSALTVTSGPRN